MPTIIDRAKRNNFYFLRPKRKAHDKEVITNYPGELIQYDSSHHQFAPYAASKWYLITSLDDYSRLILYALLVERESTWEHILALEYANRVFLLSWQYVLPLTQILWLIPRGPQIHRTCLLLRSYLKAGGVEYFLFLATTPAIMFPKPPT